MLNETKMFSEALTVDPFIKQALIATSRSPQDAALREKCYAKMFSNFRELKEAAKTFSGYTEIPLLSNQYFNATVASYVSSFAGFLAIERAMDQPTALLYFLDLVGAADDHTVMPNIGADNLANISSQINFATTLDTGTNTYNFNLGVKVIPGSLVITVQHSTNPPVIITDNRAGSFLAAPGVLAAASVVYANGAIAITFGSGYTPATGDTLVVVGYQDAPGTPNTGDNSVYANRFKTDLNQIQVNTAPDMLVGESNLIALAAMQKSTGVNAQDVLAGKLTELYTKLINQLLVNSTVAAWTANGGASATIDITHATTGFLDYRSQLDKLNGNLTDVDGLLAAGSYKGCRATAYLVGQKTADWMKKCSAIGLFRENTTTTYVNDLVGYFNNIPVLRHISLGTLDGYAIHKTVDGQLAPSMRGIFLPLTNTPTIGNYNNPTQMAQGVFYQEGITNIASSLVQKFTLSVDN